MAKRVQHPQMILTMDTETRGLFGDVFRVGLYDENGKYYVSSDTKTIRDIIYNYSKKYECHIFIHNLDFDIAKMAHEFIPFANLRDSVFINNNVTMFNTNLTTMHDDDTELMNTHNVVFHDSLKLIMGSLANICKDFGIDDDSAKFNLTDHIINLGWAHDDNNKLINTKLPLEEIKAKYNKHFSEGYYFENVDPFEKVLNHYLRKDCESLMIVLKTLIEISGLPTREFLKCPTTASLALKVFNTLYEDDFKKICSTHYHGKYGNGLENYIREAYYGGRTECFVPESENGFHYDVNSLYPSVMKTKKIPFGKAHYIDNPQRTKDVFNNWYNFRNGTGFLKCKIEIPTDIFIPPLPVKRYGKLLFPVGKIQGTWTFEEIEKAMQMGAIVHEVIDCVYFEKSDYLFKDFIHQFEHMKVTSTGAKKLFAKLMQNSLYGKFGMQRIRKTLLPITELNNCIDREKEEGLRYQVLENPLIANEQFIEAETISEARYIQPHVAAYITAQARLVLLDGLLQQKERGEVYYCDTDSIVCSAPMDDIMIDDNEYGKWALESVLEYGMFLQPKMYYEKYKDGGETKKFKGLPKSQLGFITENTYTDLLKRMKEIQYKQENNIPISDEESVYRLLDTSKPEYRDKKIAIQKTQEKRIKFATSLKQGTQNFDEKIEIKKNVILINAQKRDMDYLRNTSRPHVFADFN